MTTVITPRSYAIAPLTALNYSTWNIKVEMLLTRSKVWSVVDGSEIAPPASDPVGHAAWKSKDSEARSDILLHCGDKQLALLKSLPTSKAVWDKLKQLYERSNRASQVNLHKQLCHLRMSENDDVVSFLENWQSVLQDTATAGCEFNDAQQVMLLLSALPNSWSAFVTTQGGITTLTFSELISNILLQTAINSSKSESSENFAFYIKGKFINPRSNQNQYDKANTSTNRRLKQSKQNNLSSTPINLSQST